MPSACEPAHEPVRYVDRSTHDAAEPLQISGRPWGDAAPGREPTGGPPLGAPQEGGSHMRCKTIAGALVLIAGSTAHAQWSAFNLNPPYYFLVDGSVAQAGAGTQCVGRALVIG